MRVEGPAFPAEFPLEWIGDIPRRWAAACPERAAIIVPEQRCQTSFAELDRFTQRFVEVCEAMGLRTGDRLAYLGRNSDLYYPALFGSILGGYVLVPLNWRCAPAELAFMLADSEAKLVIVDEAFADVLQKALAANVALGVDAPAVMKTEGPRSLRQELLLAPSTDRPCPQDVDQVCMQIYTSGTTGRPKGVLVTHGAFSYARLAETTSPDWADWTRDDVILSPLPNFHMGGLSWVLIGLIRGLTCVLTSDASPGNLIRLIEIYGVTRTFIVPTVVKSIIETLKETAAQPPAIKTITYGAAVMSEALLKEAIALFGCQFGQYYGMTECAGTVVYLPPADHDPARPHLLRSVGRPQAGMALEIRDADDRVLGPDRAGEIWIRTPTVMKAYWQDDEATRTAVVNGWYRTGDGGYLDREGYLYITDRIRDLIISGGENIYPAEVENVIKQHPDVLDVAVVGASDDHWGERVVAVVERRPGANVDADALIAFTAERLARFKCPREVKFLEALPRTPLGKVQRALLRTTVAAIPATSP